MATYLSPSTPQGSRYSPSARNGIGSSYESDGLVASSPLMRGDTSPQDSLRPSAPSRNASARISRELDNWRQSLALSTAGTEFELDEDEDEEDAEANDIRRSFGPDWSTLTTGKFNRPVNQKEKEKLAESEDAYSTQELDDILKSAKDQLNLLETKVSGARHSLADMPSLASYSPNSASPSSPSRPNHSKLASDENSNRLSRSPRINFGTPRTGSSISATTDRASKHARNFSETSVPSPQGQVPRGSLVPQATARRDAAQRLSLREPNVRHSRLMNSLDPVQEETPNTLKPDDVTCSPDKRTSQLSEMRGDANRVRNRLSFIQDGVRSAVEQRRSWRDGASVKPEEVEQIKEVHQLEQILRRQEELLGELEQADGGANGHSRESSVDAWQRYRSQRYSTRDFDDLTDEDDLISDTGTDYQSVLEEPMLEEVEPDFEESHENRPDAFDYEHFIIHSVLGNSKLDDPGSRNSKSSSAGSSRSISTERGRGADLRTREKVSRDVDDLQQLNGSIASFETAQSFMNTSDSDSDQEDQTSDEERELLSANGAWPVPPANEARRSLVHEVESMDRAPDASTTAISASRTPISRSARPASLVYSAVVDPLGGGARLSEDDEMLIRSLAESVRHACKELHRNQSEPNRADDWRYRLEEARKMLSGENELF